MRDRCGTLRNSWYVACLRRDISRKRPISRVILEEALVLFEDDDGQVRCFRDRCLHRNAQLSEGRVRDGCLVCPYHGWRFDPTGRCVHIPSEGPDSTGRPNRVLEAFHVTVASDLVWVWMGDGDAPRGEPFAFPKHGDAGWQSYYMVTPFDNNVTNCVENFMDVPHTITVHAGWFRSDSARPVPTTVERTRDSVLVTYHQTDDQIGVSNRILNPRNEPVTHTDRFFMPNMTRVDYTFGSKRAFVITSQCTPVTDMQTLVYTAITYRMGNRLIDAIARLALPPYTRKVIQQDVDIMANQGASLKRYGQEFTNAPVDVIHHYIESLRDYAEGGEQGPPPKPAQADVTFYV